METEASEVIEKTEARPQIVNHDHDAENSAPEDMDLPLSPDGGYSWLVLLGVFLACLLGGGLPYCWGIMQDYYEREVFGSSGSTTVQLSVAGTLIAAMIYIFSMPIGVLYNKFGAKPCFYIGTLLISVGLVAGGEATKIWHLYLSISICSGIGISILFNTSIRVIPFWFDKKRNTAFGIFASAQPFAGLVLPFIITPINNSLTAAWTFRILGLAFFVINIIACLLIKETPAGIQSRRTKRSSNYQAFREANVILWTIQAPIQMGCMLLPYTFLPSYATYIGLTDIQGSAVIIVICAMGALGRSCTGLIANQFGQLNTLIATSTIGGLSCLLIWTFAYSIGSLMAYSVVYGLCSGAFTATCGPITAFLVGMDQYSTVVGVVITISGLGCLGSTIASAIEAVSTAEPFLTYKLMTGCGCISAAIIVAILRLRLNRKVLSRI